MATTSITHNIANVSFWRKSLNWIRAFEDAMDFDPTQSAIADIGREVTELKGAVRKLEQRLASQGMNRS